MKCNSVVVQGEVELRPGATRRTVCVFAIRRVHDGNWLQEARDANFFLLMEEMVKNRKIRPSNGTAGYPIFFVKEKTSKVRLVVNHRGLNAITIKDKYPIPLMITLMGQV